jgi:ElaB/YqjD/DUF883 family membrane-anchored ribosome-binding protein
VSRRPTPGAALSDRLARAEADVEQARERVSSSVLALRDELARRKSRRSGMKTERIEAAISEAGARLRPQVQETRRRLSSWNEAVTDYIKERPGRCLLGALAVGFVVGKIARRA